MSIINNDIKKVAIIGSHGLYANYGGWDQLVINLAERNRNFEYLIFNSRDSNKNFKTPKGSKVIFMPLKASGLEGIFYDFLSIIIAYIKGCRTLLLLGNQGIPIIPFLQIFGKKNIVTNIGGIEWEREKFNFLQKQYLRIAFYISKKYSTHLIFDNQHFIDIISKHEENIFPEKLNVIPYGGDLDYNGNIDELKEKYPFITGNYFLTVSRAIPDNQIIEVIEAFKNSDKLLVVISNLSTSNYGKEILNRYNNLRNILLIDGLYNKTELDTIRRNAGCYIHTHSTCGSAPSLIEMIHARIPILAFDVPQNRYTLKNSGWYFKNFEELKTHVQNKSNFDGALPEEQLKERYLWKNIIEEYEALFVC
jgi:glycosyltransferase involved in cell wall biosynthesis